MGSDSSSKLSTGTGSGGSNIDQGGSTPQGKDLEAEDEAHPKNCCGMPINMLRYFMQTHLGPFLTSLPGMIITLGVFAIILGVGIWGATQIKEDSDYRDFMPAGSYVIDFIDVDEKYFVTVGQRVAIYGSNPDYPNSHPEMEALYTAARSTDVVMPETVQSWEHDFYTYQGQTGGVTTDGTAWYTKLNTWLQGAGTRYRGDIKFTNDAAAGSPSNPIISSRLTMNHRMCTDSGCEVSNMDTLRDVVSAATPKLGGARAPFPFDEAYLNYEQYKSIEEEAQRNIGLAFLAIFIITMLMIPHPGVSLLVFCSVIFTILEVIGFMYHWGLKIDGVTVVMLIVALGLAIDYSAHIGVAYVQSSADTRQGAVIQALADMGTPVCHGAMSTFIAIVVLAGSKSYVFISFFRQLFLATVLGAGQGMLLLPVLLTLMGPLPRGPLKSFNTAEVQPTPAIEMKEVSVDGVVVGAEEVEPDGIPDDTSHLHQEASAAAAAGNCGEERVC